MRAKHALKAFFWFMNLLGAQLLAEHPSTQILDRYDPIGGAYTYARADIELPGPVPLQFRRVYSSSHAGSELLGAGHAHNLGLRLGAEGKDKSGSYYRDVDFPDGHCYRFLSSGKRKNGTRTYYLDPGQWSAGDGNRQLDEPSRFPHIKNCRLTASKQRDGSSLWVLKMPDGSERRYAADLLREERLTSGNCIRYSYDEQECLTRISAWDAEGRLELAALDFASDPESGDVSIHGSNGHWVRYRCSKKRGQRLLWKVEKSNGRDERLHYRYTGSKERPYLLTAIEMQGGQRIELNYDANHLDLTGIRVPQARKKGMFTAYKRLVGPDGSVSLCVGPLGGRTRYWADRNGRVERVERLDAQGKRISCKDVEFVKTSVHEKVRCFCKQNSGQLYMTSVSDATGPLMARSWEYDKYGNVVLERLLGDLTGDLGRKHIKIGKHGRPIRGKNEHYVSKYRYSQDERHLLVAEWDELGTRVEYRYEDKRPLCVAKLVYEDGHCIHRSFYRYDKLGLLIEEIQDDGCDEERDSLAAVTQRSQRIIRNELRPSAAGFGLALEESDYCYDPKTGCKALLKRRQYRYDQDSRLIERRTLSGRLEDLSCERYAYDELGQLVMQQDAEHGEWLFSYDKRGNLVLEEHVDSGLTLEHRYDRRSQRVATTAYAADGGITTARTLYNAQGLVSAEIDAAGCRTDLSYDEHGRLLRREGPELLDEHDQAYRPWERFVYDALDRVIESSDHAGQTRRFRYNARDQKVEEVHPDGRTERWTYRLDGRLSCHSALDGSRENYSYDRQGRVVRLEKLASDGSLMSWEERSYDALHLIETLNADGLHVSYRYNVQGQLEEKLSQGPGVFERICYRYDANERVCSERLYASKQESAFVETQKRYDQAGRLIEHWVTDSEQALQAHVRYRYDAQGRRCATERAVNTEQWDSNTSCFDGQGRLLEQQFADGRIQRYSYEAGKRHGVWVEEQGTHDEDGSATFCTVDAQGRELRREVRDAQGQRCSLKLTRYDRRGLKVREAFEKRLAGKGQGWKVFNYSYDAAGQLTECKTSETDQPSLKQQWTYDAHGTLISSQDELGQHVDYSYDERGNVIEIQSLSGDIDERYSYDEQQRLSEFEDLRTGQRLQREYDALGRVSAETLPTGQRVGFNYNGYGKLSCLSLPNGERLRYRYQGAFLTHIDKVDRAGAICYRYSVQERDLRGRILSEQLPGAAGVVKRQWDACNRPRSIEHAHWAFHVAADGYGLDGRLLSCEQGEQGRLTSCSYSYDGLGQLTREQASLSVDYQYSSLGERLPALGEKPQHRCESNGRLKRYHSAQQDIRYEYNARQQLSAVCVNGSERYEYSYDPDGRRLSRTFFRARAGGGWSRMSTSYFLHYGQQEIGLLSERGLLLELRVLANPDDTLMPCAVAVELHGRRYVPVNDALGSVRTLLDMDSGLPMEVYDYTAFGQTHVRSLRKVPTPMPYRFQSQRWDAPSQSYAFAQRNYVPGLGRWCSPDPLGALDGPNPYAFVHNRPLSEVDPFGLWGVSVGVGTNGDSWNFNVGVHPVHPANGFVITAPLSLAWDAASWMGVLGNPRSSAPRLSPDGQPVQVQQEAADGSCIYRVPGKSLSRGAILHCNGMITDFEFAYLGAQWVSDVSGGYEVIAVHNQTHGFCTDLAECLIGLEGHATEPAYLLASVIEDFHATRPEDHRLFLSGHSQGSIHCNHALKLVSPEARQRVIAVTVGPAWPINPADCGAARNYASYHDPIPSLRPWLQSLSKPWTTVDLLRGKGNPHLSRCAKHPESPAFYDHKLWSQTTASSYENEMGLYIRKFG